MEKVKSLIQSNIRQYTMIIAMLLIWAYFQMATGGVFLMSRNLNNLFLQMCYIGACSCGMVLIMVAAQIDLSVGSVIGFTGAVIAVLLKEYQMHILPALLITLLVGALVGLWQGIWVAKVGLPSFIVTLSSQMLFRGGVLGVTGGNTIQPNDGVFKAIGQGYLPNIGNSGVNLTAVLAGIVCFALYVLLMVNRRKNRMKYHFDVDRQGVFIAKLLGIGLVMFLVFRIWASDRGIPIPVIILAVVVLVMHMVANKTAFGRHIYAIGGNMDAAKLSGINVKKTMIVNFTIMGVLTAISGVIFTSRLNSAAIAGGTGAETDIIAAAIIGGTSPAGGKGSIFGCIIGALVMASLDNGMSILSLGSFEKYIVKGLVLLLAVAVDTITNRQAS
ncbi:MAG: sugar ABC transporter permease [Lachnospiraceae bacterium]|nr:sugar ABC transporter permease [Lachnospiraceae bacterium]